MTRSQGITFLCRCAVMFILALVGILVNALIFVILGGHGHSHHGHSHSHDHDHGCGHSSDKKNHSSAHEVELPLTGTLLAIRLI